LVAVWLLAAAVSIGSAVTLAVAVYEAPPGQPVQIATLRGLENRLELTFPPGTELVEARYVGFLPQELLAKVRMPHSEVEQWLRKPPFHGEPSRDDRGAEWFRNFLGMTDWHPEAVGKFLFQSYSNRPDKMLVAAEILVSLDDPQVAVGYVHWNMP
jgi:hypothetical protein